MTRMSRENVRMKGLPDWSRTDRSNIAGTGRHLQGSSQFIVILSVLAKDLGLEGSATLIPRSFDTQRVPVSTAQDDSGSRLVGNLAQLRQTQHQVCGAPTGAIVAVFQMLGEHLKRGFDHRFQAL